MLASCAALVPHLSPVPPLPAHLTEGRRRGRAIWASSVADADGDEEEDPPPIGDDSAAAMQRRLTVRYLEECMHIARLEERAEAAETANDLAGAVEAYEELLALQPPTSPWLREQDAMRRALQEMLLESARRELACADEGSDGCELSFIDAEIQRAKGLGEDYRRWSSARALEDVGRIRRTVVGLLELSETQAREAADRARAQQSYARLVEGVEAWLPGMQLAEATRRMDDARLLRKSVEADLNRLELQLLQGDPSLAFIRDVLRSTRGEPLPLAEEAHSLWLKEQIDSGALPRDPELLRTLLAQARRDPEMVERLVTQVRVPPPPDVCPPPHPLGRTHTHTRWKLRPTGQGQQGQGPLHARRERREPVRRLSRAWMTQGLLTQGLLLAISSEHVLLASCDVCISCLFMLLRLNPRYFRYFRSVGTIDSTPRARDLRQTTAR